MLLLKKDFLDGYAHGILLDSCMGMWWSGRVAINKLFVEPFGVVSNE